METKPLYIWWDYEDVVYYELLQSNETVPTDRYSQQLRKLQQALNNKWLQISNKRHKMILLYDNARLHVAKSVKAKLLDLR